MVEAAMGPDRRRSSGSGLSFQLSDMAKTVSKGSKRKKPRYLSAPRLGFTSKRVGFTSTGISEDGCRRRKTNDDDVVAHPRGTRRALEGGKGSHRIHQLINETENQYSRCVDRSQSTNRAQERSQGGAAHPHGLA